MPEGGELKNDIPSDAKRPTRQLKTYGKQFTLSRQAFINDDIDLVTRIPARYAAAARKTINTQCYRILMDTTTPIYDGSPLFCSAHKNVLTTGTGITKDAMQAMIMALSTQMDEFGQPIIVRPAHLIVPAGYAFDMYTLFFSPTINTTGNTQAVNPLYRYRDTITPIEDPTINALCGGFGKVMPWWLTGVRGHRLYRGRLPQRPGDSHHPPDGDPRPVGLRLGHLSGLGYQRHGLPWCHQEPRRPGQQPPVLTAGERRK